MQVLTSFYRLNGSCLYDYYHLKIKKDLFNILQLHLKLILWIQLIFKTNFLFIININTSFHFVQIFIVIHACYNYYQFSALRPSFECI